MKEMKRNILIKSAAVAASALMLVCCSEENHGRIDQLDGSLPAPEKVEVTNVVRTRGGAKIWVKIPDDKNIKGVVATYTRKGEVVNAKISRYVDSLSIEGYSDTLEHEVQVCSFNVNEDKSEPVTLSIRPKAPTIITVKPYMYATAGGVKIGITGNDEKSDLAVCLLRDADLGNADKPVSEIKWREVTTLFTASNDITLTRRGLEATEAIFGCYIRDRWGNISDTLKSVLTPLPEVKIPKSTFSYVAGSTYCKDDNIFSMEAERSTYPLKSLWDDKTTTNTYQFLAVDKVPIPCWLTIDLGCVVELSRIATLPRIDYPQIFGDGHIRNFEFWGSMNPTGETGKGEHGFDDTWFCLGKFIQYKPSGYEEDGSVGSYTQEDRDAFNAGNDFELDDAEYPHAFDHLRYLRIVMTSFMGWEMPEASSAAVQIGEFTLYGRVIE